MQRREFLALLSTTLASAAGKLPANENVKWAVSLALWGHFQLVKFTDVLDVMSDTGFPGIRLTGFPGLLKTYDITAQQMEREISKRNLHVVTISFNGPANDPAQQAKFLQNGKAAMEFLKIFGANRLVVFSPSRASKTGSFETMCDSYNKLGEIAGEMGFRAGLHNHLDQMCEKPEEIDRCMELTKPNLFYFSPDTAHLLLGGSDPAKMIRKYRDRLIFLDYKDAKWTTPTEDFVQGNGQVLPRDSHAAKFFLSIYDLGDGQVDFPACHRVLKEIGYKGWICVDLDTARNGPRKSYERCGAYVVSRLEPIYK